MPALFPNADSCARLKTAIAAEVGNIQAMSEKFISESTDYLKMRIPQGTYDASWGEDPRKVRYSTSPIPDSEYEPLLVTGMSEQDFASRGCDDQYGSITALGNNRGAFGCNLTGQGIEAGFDVFYRTLTGKAFETAPMCAMELILTKHYNPYIAMLRDNLPRRAIEQFEYSLERNVVAGGRYNTSAVNGFITGNGSFPALPTGTLDLGTIRRVQSIMRVQGWTGVFEVGKISEQAFNQMRLNYKNNYNMDMVVTPESNETHHLGEDVQVVNWGGIRWVISDRPTRGFLKSNADGTYSLVPVRPTIARAGTGGGVVTDVNNDYFNCKTICNGVSYEVFEVAYYCHPTAATREAFALPQVGGKAFMGNLFNFYVRMIDGNFIPCNVDNFKFFFRLLHAYAFESTNPELMGAVVHRVAPDQVFLNTPTCASEGVPTPAVLGMQAPPPPRGDGCFEQDRNDTCKYDQPGWVVPPPTEPDPNPPNTVGQIQFYNEGPLITGPGQTVNLYVERVGGTLGAASVVLTATNGTATSGTEFTAATATLNWASGQAGRQYLAIPIIASPPAPAPSSPTPLQFTVVRSSATGAIWDGATSVVIEIENI